MKRLVLPLVNHAAKVNLFLSNLSVFSSMTSSCLRLALLAGLLAFTGCRDKTIAVYDVPKSESSSSGGAPFAGGPMMPGAGGLKAPTAEEAGIFWKVPAGWTKKTGDQIRVGSFSAKGPNGEAVDISVITFPGTVGGILANVNRWRGQVGLKPVEQPQIASVTKSFFVAGTEGTFVNFESSAKTQSGTAQKRLIGIIFMHGGNSWFVKMIGPDAAVTAQEASFDKFARSIAFTPNASPTDVR